MRYLSLEEYTRLPKNIIEHFEKKKDVFLTRQESMFKRNSSHDRDYLISENARVIASEFFVINKCLRSSPVFVDDDNAIHHGINSGYYYRKDSSGFEKFNRLDHIKVIQLIHKELDLNIKNNYEEVC